MNAPRPLLSDPSSLGGSDERSLARSLLESGREVSPPPGAKDQIWSRLEASLAAAAPSASIGAATSAEPAAPAAAAAPAKKSAASLATKLGLAGILAGGALVAATYARAPTVELAPGQGAEPASFDAQLPSVRLVSTGQMPEAARDLPTARERSASVAGAVTPESEKAVTSKPNPMREVEGVRRARSQLAAGDAAGALEELAALDREVERSTLGQERQVLTIEALAASGQRDRATQLAKAFLAASPDSPYAKRLAPFAAP